MPRKARPKSGYRLTPLDEATEGDRRLTDAEGREILRAAGGDDAEWDNDAAPLLLAAQVQTAIPELVSRYRVDRRNEPLMPKPRQVAATLDQLAQAQANMASALATLRGDAVSWTLVVDAAETADGWANDDTAKRKRGPPPMHRLQQIVAASGDWIKAARGRVPKSKRGQSPNRALQQLVGGLADVWKECTGRELNRSYKSEAVGGVAFVRAVVRTADPALTIIDVDTAMKAVLAERKARSRAVRRIAPQIGA